MRCRVHIVLQIGCVWGIEATFLSARVTLAKKG